MGVRVGGVVAAACGLAAALSLGAPAKRTETVIELVASRGGFRPKVLNLRKGEAVRLALSSADDEHCFAVDALRIEKRILPGRVTHVDLRPERTGTFPFHCCLEPGSQALHGRLVVIE